MPDAIINTMIFEITCGSETAARDVRNEILHYKAYRINSILSKILSKKMGSGSLWKIDRLEIDLGNIRAEDIGTDYMLQQFEVLFSKNIDEATNRHSWETVPTVSVMSPAEDQMRMIRTLFISGNLPWWIDKSNFRSVDHVVKQIISENREELRIFLEGQTNNPDLVKRIGSFCSTDTISLLNKLVPGLSGLPFPGPPGLRGKRIYPSMFPSLHFEQETLQSVKRMMIDRLLENPGLRLVTALEWLDVLSKQELAGLEMHITARHTGGTENARQILQKLSIFQLEYLSHPALFEGSDRQAGDRAETEMKRKMTVYLTDQIDIKNVRLANELLKADGDDLKTLQNIFRRYKREGSFKEKLIDLITEHPYFLQYGLPVLLANISLESENSFRAPADEKDRNKIAEWSQTQALKEAQSDFLNVAGHLPEKKKLLLNELFSPGTMMSPAAKKMITGLLKKLTDQSLLVISGLIRVSKKEMEKLSPVQYIDSPRSTDKIRNIIENSGISLLAPYLTAIFNQLGFTEQGRFKTKSHAYRAAYLLEYIVSGRQRNYDYTMKFNKLLCGLHSGETLPRYKRLTLQERNEAEELIGSIIKNWKALKSTSSKGFRKSFLQRKGILTEEQDGWTLQVEKKGYDLLLDSIPWSFNLIKLPWMDKLIRVEW